MIDSKIPEINHLWSFSDWLGAIKVRCSLKRNLYKVSPGLYKLGTPTSDSDVLVTSNYKLTFDLLRKNLSPQSFWILVLDTHGVNVWCSAGKKVFSNSSLIQNIYQTKLHKKVNHRKIILPQLSATSINAAEIKKNTGFKVIWGPVDCKNILPFIENKYQGTIETRRIHFSFLSRLILIPVEILIWGKNLLKLFLVLMGILLFTGVKKPGKLFPELLKTLNDFLFSLFSGAFLSPVLLPFIPGKSFSSKGFFLSVLINFLNNPSLKINASLLSSYLMRNSLCSFIFLNFSGSTPFASPTSVEKEMKKWVLPQIIMFLSGLFIRIQWIRSSKCSHK